MSLDEQESLARAHVPRLRALIGVVVVTVVVVLGATGSVLARPGTVEHALGLSTEQTAKVTAVDDVAFCTRTNRDVYTLEWDEGGQRRSEQIGRCGDPWTVGDEVEIWSTSGVPQTSSPTTLRVAGATLVLGLVIAFALALRAWYRVRRATRSALHGTWRPESVRTFGRPGLGLRTDPPARLSDRPRHRGRTIHSAPGHDRSPGLPGTFFVDTIRRGRPRGLSLHATADGGRVWSWHG